MRLSTIVGLCLATAACGSGKPAPSEPGTGTGSSPPSIRAQTTLGWGRAAATGGKINLFLEVTDHTGAGKAYPLGESPVPCQVAAGNGTDIITTLACLADGSGAEFRAVYRGATVIVLRRAVDPSDDPSDIEFAFREVQRIEMPAGTKVIAAE